MPSRSERRYERIMRRRRLLEVLEEMGFRKVPKRRLAEFLGVSSTRLHSWASGRGRIPDAYLSRIQEYREYLEK